MPAFHPLRLLAVLISLCVAAAVAAQELKTAERIAVLLSAFPAQSPEVQQLRAGLRDLGYIEGRDVVSTWRSAAGNYDRLPSMIAEVMAKDRLLSWLKAPSQREE